MNLAVVIDGARLFADLVVCCGPVTPSAADLEICSGCWISGTVGNDVFVIIGSPCHGQIDGDIRKRMQAVQIKWDSAMQL